MVSNVLLAACGMALGIVTGRIARALGMKPFTKEIWFFCIGLILLANVIMHVAGRALR